MIGYVYRSLLSKGRKKWYRQWHSGFLLQVYCTGTNLLKRINLSEVNIDDFTVHKTP